MDSTAKRIEALRAELVLARRDVEAITAQLAKPPAQAPGSSALEREQAEQIRRLQMQVEGLSRAVDDARESARAAMLEARKHEVLERQDRAEALPSTASSANVTMELTRQVQEQLLEIESLRAAKARLSEERDRWRAEARRYGGSNQEAKQQGESAREELKRVRAHLADAIKRAETAEKAVKQLERELELEQRRQEHLRQHFMRKVSG